MKQRLRADQLTEMIPLPRYIFVRSENLLLQRNSFFDGLRSNLLMFIWENMSVKMLVIQEIEENL